MTSSVEDDKGEEEYTEEDQLNDQSSDNDETSRVAVAGGCQKSCARALDQERHDITENEDGGKAPMRNDGQLRGIDKRHDASQDHVDCSCKERRSEND